VAGERDVVAEAERAQKLALRENSVYAEFVDYRFWRALCAVN